MYQNLLCTVVHWVVILPIILCLVPVIVVCYLVGGTIIRVYDNCFGKNNKFKRVSLSSSANLIALEREAVADLVAQNKGIHVDFYNQPVSYEINDHKICIESHSVVFRQTLFNPNAKHILLIHGANSGPIVWFPCVPLLVADNYVVHCIALPGFGETLISANVLNLNANDLLDCFVKYLSAYIKLNCLDRVRVIGHSFGAFLATALACRFPEGCEMMVLVNGIGIFPILGPTTIYWCILFYFGFPNGLIKRFGNNFNLVVFAYLSVVNCVDPYVYWNIAQMSCIDSIGEILISRFIEFNGYQGWCKCTLLSELLTTDTIPPIAMIWGIDDHLTPLCFAQYLSNLTTDPQNNAIPIELIDAWHNPIHKNNGIDFTVALIGVFNKATKLVKVNYTEKMCIDTAVHNVYASFSMTETTKHINDMIGNIQKVTNSYRIN